MVRAYRRTGARPARWVTARRITHYGPGDQVAWHWSDVAQRLKSNTWFKWIPVLDAEPRTVTPTP